MFIIFEMVEKIKRRLFFGMVKLHKTQMVLLLNAIWKSTIPVLLHIIYNDA